MIYLITGTPGAGKTCYMVSMLMKDEQFKDCPIYVDGINELDNNIIPYLSIPEGCDGSNWDKWLPDQYVLVIDECQRYWRTRPSAMKVPEAIQAMETHRHRGVDIWLLTQGVDKIDSAIKPLIEVHRHFSMSKLGVRRCFEWWQKVGNPSSRADARNATVTPYFLDEEAQKHYKSSVQHNEVKVKKSLWAYFLPVLFLFGIGMILFSAYLAYGLIWDKTEQPKETIPQQTIQQPSSTDNIVNTAAQGFTVPQNTTASTPNIPAQQMDALKPEDFKPAIDGKPWTAPVYSAFNGRNSIKSMPYPVGCVKNGNRCTCYEEQGTPIRGMDKNICLDFVENGIYNPYRSLNSNDSMISANNINNSSAAPIAVVQ